MKVSAPKISRDDQVAFAKVEKLRGKDPDDIRRALQMVCGKEALDSGAISSVTASVDALDTCDQVSYVKVETLRKIHPIMDIHRAMQNVCGRKTFSSSTYARWSRTFKEGKSVKLGYEKPRARDLETVKLLKQIVGIQDDGESLTTTKGPGSEAHNNVDIQDNGELLLRTTEA